MTERVDSPQEQLQSSARTLNALRIIFEAAQTEISRALGGVTLNASTQEGDNREQLEKLIFEIGDVTEIIDTRSKKIYAAVTDTLDALNAPDTTPSAVQTPITEPSIVYLPTPADIRTPKQPERATVQDVDTYVAKAGQLILEQNTPQHIGAISRRVFDGRRMPPDLYATFIAGLNKHPDIRYAGNGQYIRATHETSPVLQTANNETSGEIEIEQPIPTETVQGQDVHAIEVLTIPQSNLDTLAHIVLAEAKAGGFSVTELRKNVPDINNMSAEEYTHFKANFPAMRERIVAYLHSQGIVAHWETTGATRAKRYTLTVTDARKPLAASPTITETHPHQPPQPKQKATTIKHPTVPSEHQKPNIHIEPPEHIRIARERAAATEQHYSFVMANLELIGLPADSTGLKSSSLTQKLSNILGENDPLVCKAVVNRLRQEGVLHCVGKERGMALLSLKPPTPEEMQKHRNARPERTKQREDSSTISPRVFEITIGMLLGLKHVQQGVDYRRVVSRITQQTNMTEASARSAVRKLERTGVITIEQIRRTGGPMSTQTHASVIKFTSQEMKDMAREGRLGDLLK